MPVGAFSVAGAKILIPVLGSPRTDLMRIFDELLHGVLLQRDLASHE